MICGAMKVAEGIVRYCPIIASCAKGKVPAPVKLKKRPIKCQSEELAKTDLDEPLDYNPT